MFDDIEVTWPYPPFFTRIAKFGGMNYVEDQSERLYQNSSSFFKWMRSLLNLLMLYVHMLLISLRKAMATMLQ